MNKKLQFLTKNFIAHRGLHNIKEGIPENSIPAFEKAIEKKYVIEFDVHILKDGKIVVFHDDNLKRMTEINKKIKDMTYNEIRQLKLNGTKNYIPLFEEVLKLVNGKVPLLIELKYDTKCGILEKEVLKLLKTYKGEYAIQSFSPLTINWFRVNAPEVIRGQLSSGFKNEKNIIKKVVLKSMILNSITKPDFISYDIKSLPNKKIERLRSKKIILGWIIRKSNDKEKALKYCDNIICENIL